MILYYIYHIMISYLEECQYSLKTEEDSDQEHQRQRNAFSFDMLQRKIFFLKKYRHAALSSYFVLQLVCRENCCPAVSVWQ